MISISPVFIIVWVIGIQALILYIIARKGTSGKRIALIVTLIATLYLTITMCTSLAGK